MMRSEGSKAYRLGSRLLSCFLGRGEHDSLIGDFEEIYSDMAKEKGTRAADLWYWGQIVRCFPPFLVYTVRWSGEMLKNYLVISLRNMKRHKGYTFINVFGLAVGLAACLLVLLYARDELSYDRYNEKAERIQRVMVRLVREGKEMNLSGAGAPMAEAMIKEFPEVEDAVRFREAESLSVRYAEKQFRENRVVYADPSFFNVFSIRLLKGDPKTALAEPRTLVLSRTTAKKYFSQDDPVGKTLQIKVNEPEDYTVTGVFEEIPRASHFHFDIMISLSTIEESRAPVWMTFNFPTYLLLREGASPKALEDKLPSLINTHMATEIKQATGASIEEWLAKTGMKIDYYLQPMMKIHLYTTSGVNEFEPPGDVRYIYLFTAIAVFILILAGVNFINLSTARSSGRAKEVGLRKVLGSFRGTLVKQFLTESLVLSLIALAFAILVVRLALPFFNRMSGKELSFAALGQPLAAAAALGLTLLIGLLAGAYPAFFISSFRPSPILRGEIKGGIKGGRLRRILVVFQFAVSAVMIIGTIVVLSQLHYIQTKKLGFNKDQVIIVRRAYLLHDHAKALKEEMLKSPGVLKASLSSYLPVPSSRARMPVAREGEGDARNALPIAVWRVDCGYIDTLEMNITAGRNFIRELTSDFECVLINQAAVRYFGLDSPLGQRLVIADLEPQSESLQTKNTTFTIIGVVEDFHYESLRSSIAPLVIKLGNSQGNLILRVKADAIAATIETLKNKWNAFLPGEPIEYSFLDESFNAMYNAELRLGRIFGVFAGLAIFIGCLGLFGLASFSAAKRTKEIGIHKVMGATVPDIVRLLIKEYILLVLLANLVAWPLAHWLMSKWLGGFAYRTGIGWAVFAGTGALTILVALLTVSFQSVKAALTDPAVVLKYE
jgi:putative ABC transport system permease protein